MNQREALERATAEYTERVKSILDSDVRIDVDIRNVQLSKLAELSYLMNDEPEVSSLISCVTGKREYYISTDIVTDSYKVSSISTK